ncbi:hypothetical protein K9U40_22550 [Xanthobacter autotrophicus]|uniref:hypothetical protein n=1 Tax=Xanthobacter TaxID=279 RepID=UPI0024AA389D|nr:hypothetical protein [Xanthobacter autotrophicus]MDI4667080.1 hypothetical protein [Xanthobacter autotrophicus]
MPLPIWRQSPDLMVRLTTAQNHPANARTDIMTFAGMCDSREELERHVARYERAAAEFVPPRRNCRKAA